MGRKKKTSNKLFSFVLTLEFTIIFLCMENTV